LVDDDLSAGCRLSAYRFTDPTAAIRAFVGVPVTLTLLDPSGQSIERAASYQVTLEPTPSVLRGD
jgi:hypothetical protein